MEGINNNNRRRQEQRSSHQMISRSIVLLTSLVLCITILCILQIPCTNGFSHPLQLNHRRQTKYRHHSFIALPKTRVSQQSVLSSSTTKLNAFLPDLNLEDLIYNAQSTAGTLASETINSSSTLSTTSISSLAVLYFAGLLTSFSPCSLGLLPLTISYISTAAGERDDKAVFLPTIAFASGLAAVFCGLGLSVSLIGGVFGSSPSSDDNLLGAFLLASLSSGISIAMGLQILDLIQLPLPSLEFGDFSSKLSDVTASTAASTSSSTAPMTVNSASMEQTSSELAFDEDGNIIMTQPTTNTATTSTIIEDEEKQTKNKEGTDGLFRTFLLGGSSALVASPCATPVLTSILGFVAASRDPALGAILLFIYTIGYSTPLLVVGASGGQALANAQAAAMAEEDSILARVGQFVTPLTACILIWYGTNGILEAFLGDPSLAGLAPVLE